MKKFPLFSAIIFPIVVFCGCSKEPPRVHVSNLNAEKVTISIKPVNGETVNINDVAPGTTSEYTDISVSNGGTVSASRAGTNPKDINFYSLDGDTYLITLSAGDNPVLTWQRE